MFFTAAHAAGETTRPLIGFLLGIATAILIAYPMYRGMYLGVLHGWCRGKNALSLGKISDNCATPVRLRSTSRSNPRSPTNRSTS